MSPPLRYPLVVSLFVATFWVLTLSADTHAQPSVPQLPRLDEEQVDIDLDGFLDEAVWNDLPYVDGTRIRWRKSLTRRMFALFIPNRAFTWAR